MFFLKKLNFIAHTFYFFILYISTFALLIASTPLPNLYSNIPSLTLPDLYSNIPSYMLDDVPKEQMSNLTLEEGANFVIDGNITSFLPPLSFFQSHQEEIYILSITNTPNSYTILYKNEFETIFEETIHLPLTTTQDQVLYFMLVRQLISYVDYKYTCIGASNIAFQMFFAPIVYWEKDKPTSLYEQITTNEPVLQQMHYTVQVIENFCRIISLIYENLGITDLYTIQPNLRPYLWTPNISLLETNISRSPFLIDSFILLNDYKGNDSIRREDVQNRHISSTHLEQILDFAALMGKTLREEAETT
ncbi:MAG: hypothetical protein KBD31_01775 [Proteobacteria bacterium]|nr:hypothetical protein [Pseudomonadota bacterium]